MDRPSPDPETEAAIRGLLRDGTPVLLRPIEPDDKARLLEGLRGLSPRTRFLRFGQDRSDLGPRELAYLTEVDGEDHAAWVAVDPTRPGQPGLGVARYVRLPDEPSVAEAAVVVLDTHQGRGIGTLLLAALHGTAVANGVRSFRAYVLAENAQVLELLDEVGGARVTPEGGGQLRVDVPLEAEPAGRGTRAARVLKAFARVGGGE